MKTNLTLFATVLAVALFGMGCSSLDKGLVAYYPFNGNAKDESGNGNDGEVARVELSEDRFGSKKSAYHFDGGYVKIPPLKYGSQFAVSLWFLSDSNRKQLIFSKKNSGVSESVQIYGSTDGKMIATVFSSDDAAIGRITSDLSSLLGRWSHFILVYDGGDSPSSIKVYVNSEKVDQTDFILGAKGSFTGFNDLSIPREIGSQNSGEDTFKGSIDDVRIYNRALSAEEVKALYDLEKPKGN